MASPSDTASQESSPATNLTQQSLHVLHQFLAYADPESASLLPLNRDGAPSSIPTALDQVEAEIPIPAWNILYTTTTPPLTPGGFASSITVRSHPDPNRYLFSVQSTLPGVTARQFWSLMASAENRKLWDTTVEEGAVKRWFSTEIASADPSAETARAVAARVELLRFGSIFMVAKAETWSSSASTRGFHLRVNLRSVRSQAARSTMVHCDSSPLPRASSIQAFRLAKGIRASNSRPVAHGRGSGRRWCSRCPSCRKYQSESFGAEQESIVQLFDQRLTLS